MDLLLYFILFMTVIGGGFLILFLYALHKGQFQDLETPAHKILLDDDPPPQKTPPSTQKQ